MSDDPFERVRRDLDTALDELTQSTRTLLDGILVPSFPRVDVTRAIGPHAATHARGTPAITTADDATTESPAAGPAVGPVTDQDALPPDAPVADPAGSSPGATRSIALTIPSVTPRAPVAGVDGHSWRPTISRAVLALVMVVLVGAVAVPATERWWSPDEPREGSPVMVEGTDAQSRGGVVRLDPLPDGSVRVTQVLRLRAPVSSIELDAPRSRRDGPRVPLAVVEGTDVQTIRLGESPTTQKVSWASPNDRLKIRYTVPDGIDFSGPEGRRGLLNIPLLGVDSPEVTNERVLLTVSQASLRGVACGSTPRAMTPCGQQRGRGWMLPAHGGRSTSILATASMSGD